MKSIDIIEMTDADGDALTLITRAEGTWITCTSGDEEVTVGPFPTQLLLSALEAAGAVPGAATGDRERVQPLRLLPPMTQDESLPDRAVIRGRRIT